VRIFSDDELESRGMVLIKVDGDAGHIGYVDLDCKEIHFKREWLKEVGLNKIVVGFIGEKKEEVEV